MNPQFLNVTQLRKPHLYKPRGLVSDKRGLGAFHIQRLIDPSSLIENKAPQPLDGARERTVSTNSTITVRRYDYLWVIFT
jgi:hypothetical protein